MNGVHWNEDWNEAGIRHHLISNQLRNVLRFLWLFRWAGFLRTNGNPESHGDMESAVTLLFMNRRRWTHKFGHWWRYWCGRKLSQRISSFDDCFCRFFSNFYWGRLEDFMFLSLDFDSCCLFLIPLFSYRLFTRPAFHLPPYVHQGSPKNIFTR